MQPETRSLPPGVQPIDLIWGIKGIAAAIGRTVRQTEIALNKGELPGRRVNGRWVVSRKKLIAHFEEVANV